MDLKAVEKSVEAAADALVTDVVATVRNHPKYAELVNTLVDKAVEALAAGI